jgi:hypothetical protein
MVGNRAYTRDVHGVGKLAVTWGILWGAKIFLYAAQKK